MGVRDDEFVEFVQRCSVPLRRTAFLMCGDWHRAEDLVQTTLSKLFRAWSRVQGMDQREAYARRILLRPRPPSTASKAHLSLTRTAGR